MCEAREPDRESERDDEQALEEIRQLFARYREVARHAVVTERNEIPDVPAGDRDTNPALAAR